MVNMDTGHTAGFRGEILPLGSPSPRALLSSCIHEQTKLQL